MLYKKLYFQIILTATVLVLVASPTSSVPIDAYGGYISDSNINQNDVVKFSGTFHNFDNSPMYVHSFNVSFLERLGENAPRAPDLYNISRYFESDRRSVNPNSSLSASITEEINFDPGAYDVSIFFQFTDIATDSQNLNSSYALVNATFIIEGATQALEIATVVFYFIVAITVGVIGLLVYNKFKKPSY